MEDNSKCAWCGNEIDLKQKHYGSPDTEEKIHVKDCGEEFKNSRGIESKLPVIKGGEDKVKTDD